MWFKPKQKKDDFIISRVNNKWFTMRRDLSTPFDDVILRRDLITSIMSVERKEGFVHIKVKLADDASPFYGWVSETYFVR